MLATAREHGPSPMKQPGSGPHVEWATANSDSSIPIPIDQLPTPDATDRYRNLAVAEAKHLAEFCIAAPKLNENCARNRRLLHVPIRGDILIEVKHVRWVVAALE
jgi:hypothetical protein